MAEENENEGIWDDSALINAFNTSVGEYLVRKQHNYCLFPCISSF
jgi:hypothetical protein